MKIQPKNNVNNANFKWKTQEAQNKSARYKISTKTYKIQ